MNKIHVLKLTHEHFFFVIKKQAFVDSLKPEMQNDILMFTI